LLLNRLLIDAADINYYRNVICCVVFTAENYNIKIIQNFYYFDLSEMHINKFYGLTNLTDMSFQKKISDDI